MALIQDDFITVVIPTYQRCESVRRALQALARQTLPPDAYEVIVCIDGSDDGTEEMVANLAAPYLLRALWQSNQGRAAACNAGIRRARGDLIVLLDDDMEPTSEFLAAHRRAHANADRLGVMGAVPIFFDRASPPVVQYIGAKFNEHLARLAHPNHVLQLRDFYSGNFSIRRQVLLAVGLFDEAFKIYGNEDLELSIRLRQAGVQFVYSPDAAARQHYNKNFAGLARDNLAKGRTSVLLADKHAQIVADLRLSRYHHGSRQWRFTRAALLNLSRIWQKTPDWLIWLVSRVEQWWPTRMHLCYSFVLDYFYWLGARSALRETTVSNGRLGTLAVSFDRDQQ